MEKGERIKKRLEEMIANAQESITNNEIIKKLCVLRDLKPADLEVKMKSCDTAIESDEKYIAELRILLANENSL